jgi:hypothetical protein
MRFFVSKQIPHFDRVVLVESGSRQLLEDLLPGLYGIYGPDMQLDLVTCYGGQPDHFRSAQGRVYRITDYPGPDGRVRLVNELRERNHSILGMICSDEPIMTKWKWMLAIRLRGKTFLLNENGDYFWFDRGNLGVIWHFMLYRAGLTGSSAVATLSRILLFPFTFLYLLLFAAFVHARRKVRA